MVEPMRLFRWLAGTTLCGLLLAGPAPRAEIIEEVVAWVNGDVITKSDLEDEEQALVSEAYRRHTGAELDKQVEEIRENLLMQLIDRKILYHQAQRRYVMDQMKIAFYEQFKAQQKVEDDEEFERLLAREGMTVEDLKERLAEMFAPDEVIRYEVSSRIAVGDSEIEAYYNEHQEDLVIPGEVTLREIVFLADGEAAKEAQRAECEAALQRVATEDFGEVAKEVSEAGTRSTGGLLGPLKKGDLSGALKEVAFNLPVGEVSEILDMPYGLHILKIESRKEDGVPPLDEIRDRLRKALENRMYFEELGKFMEKARKEAEWCVKLNYRDRLSGAQSPECQAI